MKQLTKLAPSIGLSVLLATTLTGCGTAVSTQKVSKAPITVAGGSADNGLPSGLGSGGASSSGAGGGASINGSAGGSVGGSAGGSAPGADAESRAALGERYDPAAEEVISKTSLHAWRRAVEHAKRGDMSEQEWKRVRAEDEKAAMEELQDLSKRFPEASTVKFMMGQVKQHHRKMKEAADFYRAAMDKNTHNSMYLFKLAHASLEGREFGEAEKLYRELLTYNPDFNPGKVGLAQCLLATGKKEEASKLVAEVLKAEPDNQEAKNIQKQIKDGKRG